MLGMTYKEFYDKLYYGCDILMSYNNYYYLLNAANEYQSDKFTQHKIRLYKCAEFECVNCSELYNMSFTTEEESINSFLNSKVFDNRVFYDV